MESQKFMSPNCFNGLFEEKPGSITKMKEIIHQESLGKVLWMLSPKQVRDHESPDVLIHNSKQ